MDRSEQVISMNHKELEDFLPHKGKALLLDDIYIYPEQRVAHGFLTLSFSRRDYLFEGHEWAMPGHYISEFANITAACLVAKLYDITFDKRRGVFLTHNCSDFKYPVRLDDQIQCKVLLLEYDGRHASFQATVTNQNGLTAADIPSIKGAILGGKK